MTSSQKGWKSSRSLEISTLLFLQELQGNDCVGFPISDPSLASYGALDDILEEERLFLREFLAEATPEVLSGFSLPKGISLKELDIPIPWDDPPPRMPKSWKITIPCVLIPAGKDLWVYAVPLRHTFYVSQKEDLEAVITSEVQRMAAAQILSLLDYLRLLPARGHRLLELTVSVERGESITEEGAGASLKKKLAERQHKKRALRVLDSVAQPLHAIQSVPRPLIGREEEEKLLSALLGGKERLSVALLGPELVGKTALFLHWLAKEKAAGKKRYVYATSGAQLIAGMSGMGQWQERVRRVMEAAETLDAVLYFDNLGDLLAERPGSYIDLAGAMKPFLEEGRVRLVGELPHDSLDRLEGRHVGFFGCLNRIQLKPMRAQESLKVLEEYLRHDKKHSPSSPQLSPKAVQPLIDLLERYLPYRAFPGKAVRFYEELRAIAEKEHSGSEEPKEISTEEVFSVFAVKTGIPQKLLREDKALPLKEIVEFFEKRIIGQKEAIRRVAETICVIKAGMQPAGKPLATFLFLGPTGVGKTELARTLARYLFGAEERLLRFDMSEYMDPGAAERLIRGNERAEGLLTRKIRQEPFCVLLLDEIEKAHPAVYDLLLQVCGEGRLTDVRGRTAYFHNTIIIMTSNLGAAARRPVGGFARNEQIDEEEFYLKQVNRSFRPEFVNRLDRIIVFHPLSLEEIRAVTRLVVDKVQQRRGLLDLGVSLTVTENALDFLTQGGFYEKYGARALRRHVEDQMVAPIARLLGRLGAEARGAKVSVSTPEDKVKTSSALLASREEFGLCFHVSRPAGIRRGQELHAFSAISQTRRAIDRCFALERVVQIKERIDFLIAQMSYGQSHKNPRDRRMELDISELQAEHHRLADLWERATSLRQEAYSAEELGFLALFEGEELKPFSEEVKLLYHRFLQQLVYLLLALEPHRDQITLLVQELDEGKAFSFWLAPLLRALASRKWSAEIHIDGGRALPDEKWYPGLRWGPPRSPEEILEELRREERPKSFLLRCQGPYAGVLLALEGGLHRFRLPDPEGSLAYMLCHRIALRTSLTEKEWRSDALLPVAPPSREELAPERAVRELDIGKEQLFLAQEEKDAEALSLKPEEYWERFEEIAVRHLLAYEHNPGWEREDLFTTRLPLRPLGR